MPQPVSDRDLDNEAPQRERLECMFWLDLIRRGAVKILRIEPFVFECRLICNGFFVGYWSFTEIVAGIPPVNPYEEPDHAPA